MATRILPVKLLKELTELFKQNFPEFKETWQGGKLSFEFPHESFIVKAVTPIMGENPESIKPLRLQFINLLIEDAGDCNKRFYWRSGRAGLNFEKALSSRLNLIIQFVKSIELCKNCGEAYPFPYMTGNKCTNKEKIHLFELKCPKCESCFSPTTDRRLEVKYHSNMNTNLSFASSPSEGGDDPGPNSRELFDMRLVTITPGSSDDAWNPNFKLRCNKSCQLDIKNFENAQILSKLKTMFFEGSHIELELEKDHFLITAREFMDCKIQGEEMIIDRKFKLFPGVIHRLMIDDVPFNITGTGFQSRIMET